MNQVSTGQAHGDLEAFAIQLIAAVLERLCVPFLMVDRSGRLLMLNDLSSELLTEGRHMRRGTNDQLTFLSAGASSAFGTFLEQLDTAEDETDLLVPGGPDDPPLHVALSRFVAPPFLGRPALPPIVVLFFRSADRDEAIEVARDLYGFSVAETAVLRAILEGEALRSYADRRRISIHTARKQLHAVMQKAGVTSQARLRELIDRLARPPAEQRIQ